MSICECHLRCVLHIRGLRVAVLDDHDIQCLPTDVPNCRLHVFIYVFADVLVDKLRRCLFCLKIEAFLFICGPRSASGPPSKPLVKPFPDDAVSCGFPRRYEVVRNIRSVPNQGSERFYRSPDRFMAVDRVKCSISDPFSNMVLC
ncbi:hypothetical protein C468_05091 [Halorubrum kocurii JCM 14978]|uniref:Uncharacterized protein n=1 Tax=Halorubrum kocurii JCM 14978 TaxID=1230456 RepID=M0P823_9EURY|nr:hypothetical protein C468_05091 [Halorubrum kocurii JCM 14978]